MGCIYWSVSLAAEYVIFSILGLKQGGSVSNCSPVTNVSPVYAWGARVTAAESRLIRRTWCGWCKDSLKHSPDTRKEHELARVVCSDTKIYEF
ncbi:hypothetical protein BABINDRAFT_162792 [Babjeviella inositovora NRRL Y-12698]|uniref:Uncharacterized protein n=1 Tax=Babjeviella inositovora NRRL Y-12698 TaxID=984486 RepID=A0A1E3QLU3_9ASCO|nr:uncharacterized protein BABINDRAFT_162792 [Babjeviella inositovora NRRL Y-12698]ODQ78588.1 hypothetical protein BABINDRAFT_162792 [Babjeviella inositovora NRRL Y-12698]